MSESSGQSFEFSYAPFSLENPDFLNFLRSRLFQIIEAQLPDSGVDLQNVNALDTAEGLEALYESIRETLIKNALRAHEESLRPTVIDMHTRRPLQDPIAKIQLPETFDEFAGQLWSRFETSHYQSAAELAGRLILLGPESEISPDDIRAKCLTKVYEAAWKQIMSVNPCKLLAGEGSGGITLRKHPLSGITAVQKFAKREGLNGAAQTVPPTLAVAMLPDREMYNKIFRHYPDLYSVLHLVRTMTARQLADGKLGTETGRIELLDRIRISSSHPWELDQSMAGRTSSLAARRARALSLDTSQ